MLLVHVLAEGLLSFTQQRFWRKDGKIIRLIHNCKYLLKLSIERRKCVTKRKLNKHLLQFNLEEWRSSSEYVPTYFASRACHARILPLNSLFRNQITPKSTFIVFVWESMVHKLKAMDKHGIVICTAKRRDKLWMLIWKYLKVYAAKRNGKFVCSWDLNMVKNWVPWNVVI